MDEQVPQLPSLHRKSQVLEIHRCENKDSHKVEGLAKITKVSQVKVGRK
jgi:hypothetical protein